MRPRLGNFSRRELKKLNAAFAAQGFFAGYINAYVRRGGLFALAPGEGPNTYDNWYDLGLPPGTNRRQRKLAKIREKNRERGACGLGKEFKRAKFWRGL